MGTILTGSMSYFNNIMTLDILMVASVYCEWGTRSGCRVLPYARGATGSKKQIDTSGQLRTYQKMVDWKTVRNNPAWVAKHQAREVAVYPARKQQSIWLKPQTYKNPCT